MATPSSISASVKGQKRPSIQPTDEGINWEGYHDYMTIKRKKLRDQAESLGGQRSSIFEGVTIYVNGYTHPNADELKERIHHHGGVYEYSLSSAVTHVIATNLPTAKIRNLNNSTLVCRPGWIVDSIEAGKQLAVEPYLLYRACSSQKQIQFKKNPQEPSSTRTLHTAGSKDFVSEFYSHSRLHHLSMWGREMKEFTSKVLPTVSQKIPQLDYKDSLRGQGTRVIVHVDVDCFFVSVSLLDKPHLKGKPVAVTHAKSTSNASVQKQDLSNSMSDIASCSYEARSYGVKNGMFVSTALSKCPDLVFVPYNFEKYRQVSQIFYETLVLYSHQVEAVSCDEAFIELSDYASDVQRVCDIVEEIRSEVLAKTGCTVSAGISHNMLLARVATRKAKPNGQFFLTMEKVHEYLADQPVKLLPGVGWALGKKLDDFGIESCGQLQEVPLETLRHRHGAKTGEMLYYFCRGMDQRELQLNHEKKSMSVDINFGIRFKEISEAEELLMQLAEELEKRLKEAEVCGECVCLKVKVRKASAPSKTRKFLGHGACDNLSKSFHLLSPTQDGEELGRIACRLLKQVKTVAADIRGMGIQLSKLVSQTSPTAKKAISSKDIRSMMGRTTDSGTAVEEVDLLAGNQQLIGPVDGLEEGPIVGRKSLDQSVYSLPPVDDLDQSVLLALPLDMQEKIFNEYSKSGEEKAQEALKLNTVDISTSSLAHEQFATDTLSVTSKNQDKYVDELRKNIKKWINGSPSGPTEVETESFINFMSKLGSENTVVVCLALKCLRRVIVSRQLVREWGSLFNNCLAVVQNNFKAQKHGGILDINSIVIIID